LNPDAARFDLADAAPEGLGFDAARLEKARSWLEAREVPHRLLLVRRGAVAVDWAKDIDRARKLPIASAAKSVYSNILGIAVADGQLGSVDEPVFDRYPDFMDVPEGEGPKPGRYAFAKDRQITYRQLIGNTSGYMKPGEKPGTVFHYQTYGMNVLTHAIAGLYGLWDRSDPEGCPGFARLVEDRISRPIGAELGTSLTNFDLQPRARLKVFGYYTQIHTTARDAGRLGWLWCCGGTWAGRQIVPGPWLEESTHTSAEIRANAPEEQWRYGYGFWTNDHGRLWPDLPRDGFSASGAGGHFISVFPGLELVVVQNPGPYAGPDTRANPELLRIVLESLQDTGGS
jgi:CubicO group peptidase (beta-lactamase class C family)